MLTSTELIFILESEEMVFFRHWSYLIIPIELHMNRKEGKIQWHAGLGLEAHYPLEVRFKGCQSNITIFQHIVVKRDSIQEGGCLASSKNCSKFPDKLLLFKKVASLNVNHTHIH